MILRFVALLVAVGLAGCDERAEPAVGPVALTLVDSTADVPISPEPDLQVLPSGVSCTSDGYLVKVHCFDPRRDEWATFGAEGEGPGEFESVSWLIEVEGRDSALAVADLRNGRLTVFRLDGTHHDGFRLPPLFRPLSPLSPEGLWALWMPYAPSDSLVGHLVHIDRSGEVTGEAILTEASRAEEPLGFLRGAVLPDGSVFLHVEAHRFGRYTLSGGRLAEFEYPEALRAPVYPGDRDMDLYAEAVRRITGRAPDEAQMDAQRDRPLHPVVGRSRVRLGPDTTVWLASARDRVRHSYLDIFRNDAYAGSVRVRHRLLSFDIQGDTLVVLVERPEAVAGEYPLGLDWYRIRVETGGPE